MFKTDDDVALSLVVKLVIPDIQSPNKPHLAARYMCNISIQRQLLESFFNSRQ